MGHLPPKQALQFLQAHPDALFIDCRSEMICRSGNRSQEAGEELERAGFKQVFNVEHGFEGELDEKQHRNTRAGWRFEGLPWEQC